MTSHNKPRHHYGQFSRCSNTGHSVFDVEGLSRMRRIRLQYQSQQKLSPARFAGALALTLLTAIGGAVVTVWNTQELMAVLGL